MKIRVTRVIRGQKLLNYLAEDSGHAQYLTRIGI